MHEKDLRLLVNIMKKNIKNKKIAILTSGGDSPGMNAVIRSVVRQAMFYGFKTYLVYEGYKGLVNNKFVEANVNEVDSRSSSGGTFIYTSRLPEFTELATRKIAAKNLLSRGIDTLVVIGGDGSYKGAQLLSKLGINCICLPGTIDNDIGSSEFTIGFYTALESIGRSIFQIRNTCVSHHRVGLIEVMGRYCGDLALYSGIASGADLIITCENIMTGNEIAKIVKEAFNKNDERRTFIIVVSEKIYGENNNESLETIADKILEISGNKTNINRLGYTQRGGNPTTMERVWATLMGIYAADLIAKGAKNRVIGQDRNQVVDYSFDVALKMKKAKRIDLINQINKFSLIK